MKGNDEITGLFRSRLAGTEMTVRDGFWEELQSDLSKAEAGARGASAAGASVTGASAAGASAAGTSGQSERRQPASAPEQSHRRLTPRFYRAVAAASVVLVLGAASAAFWYFSPKDEIQEAFIKVATMTPEGNLKRDAVQENFPSIHDANPVAQKPGHGNPGHANPGQASPAMVFVSDDNSGDDAVSVTLSITIAQRVYGHQQVGNGMYGHQQAGNGMYGQNASTRDGNQATADAANAASGTDAGVHSKRTDATPAGADAADTAKRNWAFKAGVGTSLPKGDYGMPFTAGLSAERRLNRLLSLEAGLQYNRLDAADGALHTLAIPVRLNARLASSSRVDLYALLGGAAEKCIAGTADNGFGAEPVQLSVAAGLGVRYKLNDRIALFAEPTVSHYFDTDSQTRTLRTERPVNLNLLCGVRMVY